MAVIQVPMEIPANILQKLLSGEYIRIGGVIRDTATKQIVHHLKDADKTTEVASSALSKVIALAKSNKGKVGLALTGIGVVVGGSILIRNKIKDKRNKELPENVEKFKKDLHQYLVAANNAQLNIELIDALIASVETLEKESSIQGFTIDFSAGELSSLIGYIINYTKQIAEVNSYDLPNNGNDISDENIISRLHRSLESQKEIFIKAA